MFLRLRKNLKVGLQMRKAFCSFLIKKGKKIFKNNKINNLVKSKIRMMKRGRRKKQE
jgi:hypothetical protein